MFDVLPGLGASFEEITADPECGRDRSLFAAGSRSVNYGSHVTFFAPIVAADGEPVIVRIVHQRRNMPTLVYFGDIGG